MLVIKATLNVESVIIWFSIITIATMYLLVIGYYLLIKYTLDGILETIGKFVFRLLWWIAYALASIVALSVVITLILIKNSYL